MNLVQTSCELLNQAISDVLSSIHVHNFGNQVRIEVANFCESFGSLRRLEYVDIKDILFDILHGAEPVECFSDMSLGPLSTIVICHVLCVVVRCFVSWTPKEAEISNLLLV
jgi:hypothetical protein